MAGRGSTWNSENEAPEYVAICEVGCALHIDSAGRMASGSGFANYCNLPSPSLNFETAQIRSVSDFGGEAQAPAAGSGIFSAAFRAAAPDARHQERGFDTARSAGSSVSSALPASAQPAASSCTLLSAGDRFGNHTQRLGFCAQLCAASAQKLIRTSRQAAETEKSGSWDLQQLPRFHEIRAWLSRSRMGR